MVRVQGRVDGDLLNSRQLAIHLFNSYLTEIVASSCSNLFTHSVHHILYPICQRSGHQERNHRQKGSRIYSKLPDTQRREMKLTRRDVLEDYEKKMRDAENETHEGKRRVESTWQAFMS